MKASRTLVEGANVDQRALHGRLNHPVNFCVSFLEHWLENPAIKN